MNCLKNFLFVILLVACAPKPITPVPSVITVTQTVAPTERVTETATVTATLRATETSTPVVCEPLIETCRVTRSFPLQRPFVAPYNFQFDPTYLFGTTQQGKERPHHGVEFQNGFGAPVLAAADGEVVVAGKDELELHGPFTDFYGNLIVIKHNITGLDFPLFTLYGHLSEIETTVGTIVRAGDEIGKVGKSGVANGPHLHFEVRSVVNTYADSVNPLLWFAPLNDTGMIIVRVTNADGSFINATVVVQSLDANGDIVAMNVYETYVAEKMSVKADSILQEKFVLSDLPPGAYRILVKYKDFVFGERIVEIAPNEVLLAAFEKK